VKVKARLQSRAFSLFSQVRNGCCEPPEPSGLCIVSPVSRDCRETVMGRESIGNIVLGILLGAAIVFVAVGFAVDWAAESIKTANVNPPLFFIPK
jgi:hypothetical protein